MKPYIGVTLSMVKLCAFIDILSMVHCNLTAQRLGRWLDSFLPILARWLDAFLPILARLQTRRRRRGTQGSWNWCRDEISRSYVVVKGDWHDDVDLWPAITQLQVCMYLIRQLQTFVTDEDLRGRNVLHVDYCLATCSLEN